MIFRFRAQKFHAEIRTENFGTRSVNISNFGHSPIAPKSSKFIALFQPPTEPPTTKNITYMWKNLLQGVKKIISLPIQN